MFKYNILETKGCDLFRYLSSHTGRTERAIFWLVGQREDALCTPRGAAEILAVS